MPAQTRSYRLAFQNIFTERIRKYTNPVSKTKANPRILYSALHSSSIIFGNITFTKRQDPVIAMEQREDPPAATGTCLDCSHQSCATSQPTIASDNEDLTTGLCQQRHTNTEASGPNIFTSQPVITDNNEGLTKEQEQPATITENAAGPSEPNLSTLQPTAPDDTEWAYTPRDPPRATNNLAAIALQPPALVLPPRLPISDNSEGFLTQVRERLARIDTANPNSRAERDRLTNLINRLIERMIFCFLCYKASMAQDNTPFDQKFCPECLKSCMKGVGTCQTCGRRIVPGPDPVVGQVRVDDSDGRLRLEEWNGSEWVVVISSRPDRSDRGE